MLMKVVKGWVCLQQTKVKSWTLGIMLTAKLVTAALKKEEVFIVALTRARERCIYVHLFKREALFFIRSTFFWRKVMWKNLGDDMKDFTIASLSRTRLMRREWNILLRLTAWAPSSCTQHMQIDNNNAIERRLLSFP